MAKYRKKPVVIEAIQFTGKKESVEEILEFMSGGARIASWKEGEATLAIPTLEGVMKASVNDWIIRGVNGEHYPCKPDIFEKTYEKVEE